MSKNGLVKEKNWYTWSLLPCCNIHTIYWGSPQGHLNSHYPAWPFKSMALMSYECIFHVLTMKNWEGCTAQHTGNAVMLPIKYYEVLLRLFSIISAICFITLCKHMQVTGINEFFLKQKIYLCLGKVSIFCLNRKKATELKDEKFKSMGLS